MVMIFLREMAMLHKFLTFTLSSIDPNFFKSLLKR